MLNISSNYEYILFILQLQKMNKLQKLHQQYDLLEKFRKFCPLEQKRLCINSPSLSIDSSHVTTMMIHLLNIGNFKAILLNGIFTYCT